MEVTMAYKITHIHDKTSQNLPPVSTTDEGKVLAVENGKWTVKESGGGGSEPVYIPTKVSEFENDDWPIIFSIDNYTDFVLTTKDILEFKPMGSQQALIITIKEGQDNPYLIINAAYEDAT